jgi:para-aminobenzoate synthetase component 1
VWSLFAQGNKGEFLYCFKPHIARMHYRHHYIDLLSGRKVASSISSFLSHLHEVPLSATFAKPKVIHLSYELGHIFHDQLDLIPGHMPLAIEIEYLKCARVQLSDLWPGPHVAPRLKFLQVPTWDEYGVSFDRIQEELLRGNAYQVNLTAPFYLVYDESYRPSDFIRHLWSDPQRIAPYAHATYLSNLGKLILSNSPECLVQRRVRKDHVELYSMPIKGSLPLQDSQDWHSVWQQMLASKKEVGELNMITDLIRNDLSRVAQPRSRVIQKRLPLRVPKILHQYALISCPVPIETTWGRVLECLFPGGSVTGAPKKSALNIIHQVETESRGHYCGSTWLAYKKTLAGSINIRTAEIDLGLKEMKYGAGGGVTLKSGKASEFEEMLRKSESFLSPFITRNIKHRVP